MIKFIIASAALAQYAPTSWPFTFGVNDPNSCETKVTAADTDAQTVYVAAGHTKSISLVTGTTSSSCYESRDQVPYVAGFKNGGSILWVKYFLISNRN